MNSIYGQTIRKDIDEEYLCKTKTLDGNRI